MISKSFNFIKKLIKPLFMVSVAVLIVSEFSAILKDVSYSKILKLFHTLSLVEMISIFILGLVAVMPMINYNIIYCKLLNINLDRKYLWQSSFSINTLNNLVGFGGLANVGLRLYYYGEKRDDKELVGLTLKMYPYFYVGISLLSFIGIVYLFYFQDFTSIKYIPWLVGGILMAPITVFISKKQKSSIPIKDAWMLSLTSLVDWTLVILLFIVIGKFLGVEINYYQLALILVAANIIGMVSMMPGGLGSFDLVMLSALVANGLSNELALTWIFLYRVSYFIIPGVIGLTFLIKYLGGAFDKKNDGVPKKVAKSLMHSLKSAMLYVFAMFLIISATIPELVSDIKWLSNLSPDRASQIYQMPSVVFGFVFILVARANFLKVKNSFIVSVVVLVMTFIYVGLTKFGPLTSLYVFVLLILVFLTKDELYKKQFIYSSENKTIDGIVCAFLVVLYAVYGHPTVGIKGFFENIENFVLISVFENWSFIVLIILVTTLFLYITTYFLRSKEGSVGEKVDVGRVKKLLENHGGGINSALAFLEDKDIYYLSDEKDDIAALQFKMVGNKIVVMSEPMGKKEAFLELVGKFVKECDELCYGVIFYEIPEYLVMNLHEYGFRFMKFGEFASVNLINYSLDGSSKRYERNIINKIEKSYKFSIKTPPYSGEFLAKLEKVSNKWLRGKAEKGFSLGFFKKEYLEMSPIAIVEDQNDEVVAFTNTLPVYDGKSSTIDLMRYDSDIAPKGVMDYLFIKLIMHFKDEGKQSFAMGMAPLSRVGIMRYSFSKEKLAYLIYKFGDYFYSFEGLRKFKEKYSDTWTPLYLSYSKGTWLLYGVIALLFVDKKDE